MKRITVSDTTYQGVFVPGGWEATIPEVSVSRSDARFQDAVAALQRVGATPLQAEEIAREAIQGVFDGRWVELLKKFVGRWAKIYQESFGDLRGFDPARLERLFLPGRDDLFGQRKHTEVRRAFEEMRRGA